MIFSGFPTSYVVDGFATIGAGLVLGVLVSWLKSLF